MCIGLPQYFFTKNLFKKFVPKLCITGCVNQDGTIEDTSHNSSSQNAGFKQEGGSGTGVKLEAAIKSIEKELTKVYKDEDNSVKNNISQIKKSLEKYNTEMNR
jgi:hypothetical protein